MSVENTRKSILSIAKVYLGMKERYNNDTIFGDWYGMPNQPWCAMFVSFCMYKAGVSQNVVKKFASCTVGWNWFAARGETRDRSYIPQKGDIIFFDWEPDGVLNHVGLVDRVADGIVYTVEGNHDDQVNQFNYSLTSNQIWGYVVPSYTGNEQMLDIDINGGNSSGTTTNYPTITKGSSGSYVKIAQNQLIEKGYSLSRYGADGIFGGETQQAVKNFQADNGLVVDGIVGPKTWAKLGNASIQMPSSYPGAVIGMGARGENVVKIQNELIRRGYEVSGGADGAYGSGCKAAVIQFQNDNGLTADGIVGKNTWDALFPLSGKISSYPGFNIGMGSRGVEVEAIQKRLIELSYNVPGGVDGAYGSGCKAAVIQFQNDKGLTADGIVGKSTWDALFPQQQVGSSYPGYLMGYGMSDNNIMLAQKKLSELGYPIGKIDGIFGDNTKTAVIRFQSVSGLKADGIIGEQTWNKLFGGPVENPQDVTDSLKEKNKPVFDMIEKLFVYAGEFFISKHHRSATTYEKNLLTLQYIRYVDYGKDLKDAIAWSIVCEAIDADFINFVDRKNDSAINRKLRIYLKNNESISLSHLAVTLETNMVRDRDSNISNAAFTDLAGWAGDLITFARDITKNQGVKVNNYNVDTLRIYLFNSSYDYSFDLEDLYQDIDAINLSPYLDVFDIGTVFRLYYDMDRTRMAERRFSLFLTGRITNGLLPAECSNVSTTEQKLTLLAKKYTVRDFNSIDSTLATAFSLLFNAYYDNMTLAPKVAEAFAKTIVSYSYNEAKAQ